MNDGPLLLNRLLTVVMILYVLFVAWWLVFG